MATAEIKESEYKVWERISSVVEKIRGEVSGIVISNYILIYALAADADKFFCGNVILYSTSSTRPFQVTSTNDSKYKYVVHSNALNEVNKLLSVVSVK